MERMAQLLPAGTATGARARALCTNPRWLQDRVIVNYYRHFKHASSQCQLNYFGFKKRLHGGKKGKLSTFSHIYDLLT